MLRIEQTGVSHSGGLKKKVRWDASDAHDPPNPRYLRKAAKLFVALITAWSRFGVVSGVGLFRNRIEMNRCKPSSRYWNCWISWLLGYSSCVSFIKTLSSMARSSSSSVALVKFSQRVSCILVDMALIVSNSFVKMISPNCVSNKDSCWWRDKMLC